MSIKVKCIFPGMSVAYREDNEYFHRGTIEWDGVKFIHDAACTDYDWLLVYDDLPRRSVGTIHNEMERLECPQEHTILATAEPPTIKLYPGCYTRQFGYVLTTHDRLYLPHRNYRLGRGTLQWIADYTRDEVLHVPDWPKNKLISAVCSNKQMKHTEHFKRHRLISYLDEQIPEMEWYGWGVKPLSDKCEALNNYKYHVAAENYIHPHHWSDKISDPILGMCLTFYAGDPLIHECLPEGCLIPIPLDDPEAALEIIQKSIRDNEYEKRLPAIREARRIIVSKYNLYSQAAELIRNHTDSGAAQTGGCIKGRHRLRRNPLNAIEEFAKLVRFRLLQPVK